MKKILVVDDDPLMLELVEAVLDEEDIDIRTAEGADAALAFAVDSDAGVDLLITDFSMPGMDGERLAERIESRFPGVRVLLMSGRPDDAAIARSHAGWLFVNKPFDLQALHDAVTTLLGESR